MNYTAIESKMESREKKANNLYESIVQPAALSDEQRCFTFQVPDWIIKKGIFTISIFFKSTIAMDLYVHQKGLLKSALPSTYLSLKTDAGQVSRVKVVRENLHMLDHDGEPCNDNDTFDWFKCKHEFIFKVKRCLEHTYLSHTAYFINPPIVVY